MKKILTTFYVAFSFTLFSPMANASSVLDQIIYEHSAYEISELLQLLAPDKDQDPNEFVQKLPTIPTQITWKTLNEDGSKYFHHPAQYGDFQLRYINPQHKNKVIYINKFSPTIMTYLPKDNQPAFVRLGIDYFYSYFTNPSTPFEKPREMTSQLLIHYLKQQNITFEILESPSEKPTHFFEGPTLLKISFPDKKHIWLSIKSQLTNRAHITDILILYSNPQNDQN